MSKKTVVCWVDRIAIEAWMADKLDGSLILHPCQTGIKESNFVQTHKDWLIQIPVTFETNIQKVGIKNSSPLKNKGLQPSKRIKASVA